MPHNSPYPYNWPSYGNNNKMISDKESSEELDKNIQKRLQKVVEKFLYYATSIHPTILMTLNSLVTLHKKSTIDTAKIDY